MLSRAHLRAQVFSSMYDQPLLSVRLRARKLERVLSRSIQRALAQQPSEHVDRIALMSICASILIEADIEPYQRQAAKRHVLVRTTASCLGAFT